MLQSPEEKSGGFSRQSGLKLYRIESRNRLEKGRRGNHNILFSAFFAGSAGIDIFKSKIYVSRWNINNNQTKEFIPFPKLFCHI
uniref:hypothetical protein n=2 Tax=Flavobacterium sp. TaxID=239 RepID=UPI0040499472